MFTTALRSFFLIMFVLAGCDSSSEESGMEIPCGETLGTQADFSLANREVEGAQVGEPTVCEAGVDISLTRSAGSNSIEEVVNDRAVNIRSALAGAGADVFAYGRSSCSSELAVMIDDWGQADAAVRALALFMSARGISGTVNVSVEANACAELQTAE